MPPRTCEETSHRLLEPLPAEEVDAVADLRSEYYFAEYPFAEGDSAGQPTGGEAVRGRLACCPVLTDARAASAHQGPITPCRDYRNPPAATSTAGTPTELLGSLCSEAVR